MGFSEETKRKGFERAEGCCELCGKKLVFNNRGRTGGRGSWEAHHKTPRAQGGADSLRNCMIICYECHQQPQKAASRMKKESNSGSSLDDLLFGSGGGSSKRQRKGRNKDPFNFGGLF